MQVREISLDTETTGLSPKDGHRVVEIGAVEMIDRVATGNNFHVYINPEREMSREAFAVHGLSSEFLADKPFFADIAGDFLQFIGNSRLVIHNAAFDMKFINHELRMAGKMELSDEQSFCTLLEARRRFPGSPANLDALCKRFGIDISARTKHGALLDAELLADMYLELMGGAQANLDFVGDTVRKDGSTGVKDIKARKKHIRQMRHHEPSKQEIADHEEFLRSINEPIWQ